MDGLNESNQDKDGTTRQGPGESRGGGRWPSSTLFLVLITGLLVALGILALLGLFA